MAPNKNRNQGITSQKNTATSQDFRPLAPLGVTIERLCLFPGNFERSGAERGIRNGA